MDQPEIDITYKNQAPLRLPPEGLGVAPVRIVAAGEGKIPGSSPLGRLLVLRLLASRARTGDPVRLDLGLAPADAILLARVAIRFLRQEPSLSCARTTSGPAGDPPSAGPAETNNTPPQNR